MAIKQKERSEVEQLRAVIRNLKSELKNLRKTLARANKETRKYADIVTEAEEPEFEEVETDIAVRAESHSCPKCKSKVDKPDDLGNRELYTCGSCGFRKSFPKKKQYGKI